jgi:hypothetical protein
VLMPPPWRHWACFPIRTDHRQSRADQTRRDVVPPPQLELAQAAKLFDPAKDLLDAAAGMDGFGVALMPGGAAIDRWATTAEPRVPKAPTIGDMSARY